jgi:hypothetical protein
MTTISINHKTLSPAESESVLLAVQEFKAAVETGAMGDDPTGKAIARAQKARILEIENIAALPLGPCLPSNRPLGRKQNEILLNGYQVNEGQTQTLRHAIALANLQDIHTLLH